ncbi:hypothetical protein H9Q13_10320 [Pontibacter sp. JH31]|uniref:DUF6438 domain-containing protein n=1 Tax=Pontibacter aquaedesilientis TaxID=2766980 RepID=A0ABR7XH13_9BACT|nr:DUF6438 domain-containing protein [Pontibacter aquaedesilientis]MBD1397562.1 hypothetical protein [Pontibacter aquaedesilientis]
MFEETFFLKIWLILSCLPLAIGCSASQNTKQKQTDEPYLFFQKTPCLGICPSYEATIQEDGSIRYVGWEHVPVKDTAYFKFTPEEMKELRDEVENLNYLSLQPVYLTDWSDMPSTITAFYNEGQEEKRVKHQEGGPKELLVFQEALHKRLMSLAEEEARRRLPRQ